MKGRAYWKARAEAFEDVARLQQRGLEAQEARINELLDRLAARNLPELKAAEAMTPHSTGSWEDPVLDPMPDLGGGGYFVRPSPARTDTA